MRLIDADAAIEVVHKWLEDVFCISSTADEVTVFKRLRALPTVDAEPVRHGRWVYKPNMYDDSTYECSECGEPWTLIEGTPQENGMKYCPNCDAKMDLKGEDDAETDL